KSDSSGSGSGSKTSSSGSGTPPPSGTTGTPPPSGTTGTPPSSGTTGTSPPSPSPNPTPTPSPSTICPNGEKPAANGNCPTSSPPAPKTIFKGPTQIQNCQAAGFVNLVECQQIMNIKNIHNTTVRGSTIAVGTPSAT